MALMLWGSVFRQMQIGLGLPDRLFDRFPFSRRELGRIRVRQLRQSRRYFKAGPNQWGRGTTATLPRLSNYFHFFFHFVSILSDIYRFWVWQSSRVFHMMKTRPTPKQENPLVLTIEEAAEQLRMSPASLTKEIKRGRIGCIAAAKNVRRIPVNEITRYLEAEPARYRAKKARLAEQGEEGSTPAATGDAPTGARS